MLSVREITIGFKSSRDMHVVKLISDVGMNGCLA